MFRAILLGCPLFFAALRPFSLPVEEHILVLFVTNTAELKTLSLTDTDSFAKGAPASGTKRED
ncbi:MAG TPA: hypothetical protein VE715_06080 [Blastocatellia bacterium]|nr:hypothetical protein [Blastocatellia bacterium]